MRTAEPNFQDRVRPNGLRVLLPAERTEDPHIIKHLLLGEELNVFPPEDRPNFFYTTKRIAAVDNRTYLPFETPVFSSWSEKVGKYIVRAEFYDGQYKTAMVAPILDDPYVTAAHGLAQLLQSGRAVERGIRIDTGAWVAKPDFDVATVGRIVAEHQVYRDTVGEETYRAEQAQLQASLRQVYAMVRSGELPWPTTVTVPKGALQ